jgi:hypothetical protein
MPEINVVPISAPHFTGISFERMEELEENWIDTLPSLYRMARVELASDEEITNDIFDRIPPPYESYFFSKADLFIKDARNRFDETNEDSLYT